MSTVASPHEPAPTALLIGLTGRAGSGKDTVAMHLRDEWAFEHIAFADPIVDMIGALLATANLEPCWMTERVLKEQPTPLGPSYREMAQTLGTEWGRTLRPDLWVHVAELRLDSPGLREESVVLSDVRFANEAAAIRRRGGFIVRVLRRSEDLPAVRAHASELEQLHIQADTELLNYGSKATLFDQIDRLVPELRRRHRARIEQALQAARAVLQPGSAS